MLIIIKPSDENWSHALRLVGGEGGSARGYQIIIRGTEETEFYERLAELGFLNRKNRLPGVLGNLNRGSSYRPYKFKRGNDGSIILYSDPHNMG